MNWTALLAGIRVCPGVLAATGTFIETTFPMRHKPRVIPGIENVAAWPDGEHALIEREAERDVSEPTEVSCDGKCATGECICPEPYADELAAERESQVRADAFGDTNGRTDEPPGMRFIGTETLPPNVSAAIGDMFASGGQTHKYGPRPRIATARRHWTDSDRLDGITALLEDIRNLLNAPAAPVPDADAAAEGRPAPTPPKSPVGAGQPELAVGDARQASVGLIAWVQGASQPTLAEAHIWLQLVGRLHEYIVDAENQAPK